MVASYLLTGVAIIASISSANAATKVVLTNDDGWAVANIRAKYNALVNAGFDVILSAPAVDKSGTGSSDATPTKLDSNGCEFQTCPAGAPAEGSDASNSRFNYCNSYPVTSVRYGIQELAPQFWNSKPDLVLSGPNLGANLGSTVLISGTVGAATEAAKEGIPAIAFSGDGGSFVSFTTLSKSSSSTTTANVYAQLGLKVTEALLSTSPSPILPAGIALNVNYPEVRGSCTSASAFKFVLTRINKAKSGDLADVNTCGSTRLPTETSIIDQGGCLASVSVMNASTKGDVDAATQQVVLNSLKSILSCA